MNRRGPEVGARGRLWLRGTGGRQGAAERGRGVWRFLLLALLAHGVLFVAVTRRGLQPPPDPALGGKFVKRRPLREQVLRRTASAAQRARSVRRAMMPAQDYARVTAPRARVAAVADVVSTPVMLRRPRLVTRRGVGVLSTGRRRSQAVAVEVTAADQVDLELELTDADALDTGRYRALVVQRRGKFRKLEGFVQLAAVGIRSAMDAAASNTSCRENLLGLAAGGALPYDCRHSADVRALDQLALELESQTGLRASVDEDALLHETGWTDRPFVLLTSAVDFEPTAREVEQLGRYLVGGGFVYVEVVGMNSNLDVAYGRLYDLKSLRGLVEASLTSQGLRQGVDWEMSPLGLRHPLFSCYYDIHTLPRSYWALYHEHEVLFVPDYEAFPERFAWLGQAPPRLEGIYVRGRLAGVYSQQNYRDLWARRIEGEVFEEFARRTSGDLALRLAVNIVVYALTQEGGLARRLVAR